MRKKHVPMLVRRGLLQVLVDDIEETRAVAATMLRIRTLPERQRSELIRLRKILGTACHDLDRAFEQQPRSGPTLKRDATQAKRETRRELWLARAREQHGGRCPQKGNR